MARVKQKLTRVKKELLRVGSGQVGQNSLGSGFDTTHPYWLVPDDQTNDGWNWIISSGYLNEI